jgi:catechol 2,3-dioxygenase-like lactoylglutathione lyase family enzyme
MAGRFYIVSGVTTITGWAHVTLSVRDHDRSVRWYQEILGFHPAATETSPQWTRTLCVHPGSGTILVLHQHTSSGGAEFDEQRAGLDHLALGVTDRNALAAWQERLTALGVTCSPITPTGRGGLAINFRDPDSIALELFCRTPGPHDTP